MAAVDLRTYLLVLPRTDQKIRVDLNLLDISHEWDKEELIQLSECNAGWLVKCGVRENAMATSPVCTDVLLASICLSL